MESDKSATNSALNDLYGEYFSALQSERLSMSASEESDEEYDQKSELPSRVVPDGFSPIGRITYDRDALLRLRTRSGSQPENLKELSKQNSLQRDTIVKKDEEIQQHKLFQDILSTNLKDKEKRIEQLLGSRLDEMSIEELERDELIHYESIKRIGRAIQVQRVAALRLAHRERDELIDKQRCKVCFEDNATVLALPCRHLVLCQTCAPKTDSCVICRSEITQKIETFS
eukprot:TRINITY_DN12417_c0_g1_i1.p1 TRINITY_DN12417_c0_g1~~TRINITY_DN12417_c0_g1_i1.p1  ORF type:complete len:229 (-),score=1.14 TRINITY_DN12417_c0_g1_i1:269-955(-)